MSLITPEQIKEKATRIWDNQRFLKAWLGGENVFPIEIPFKTPSGSELIWRFEEIRRWIQELRAQSKETLGHGYRIIEQEVQHRQLGPQRLPARIVIEGEADFLRLLAKQQAFARFQRLIQETRRRVPALEGYVSARPLKVLENDDSWGRILTVAEYFLTRPRPGAYLRQLDIPGVDTKFIESRLALVAEVLEAVLPAEAKAHDVKGLSNHGFERRFGLRHEQAMIRFRFLDEGLAPAGLRDLTVPLSEFEGMAHGVERVFITENKTNGICFPDVPGAMVIFGLGYGIQALAGVPWLKGMRIHYWGDIDTHGFAILSQLRGYFPQVRSMLMDRKTLLDHRLLWGQEPEDKRCLLELSNLDPWEQDLFSDLKGNGIGNRIRLEQERLPFQKVLDVVESLALEWANASDIDIEGFGRIA